MVLDVTVNVRLLYIACMHRNPKSPMLSYAVFILRHVVYYPPPLPSNYAIEVSPQSELPVHHHYFLKQD